MKKLFYLLLVFILNSSFTPHIDELNILSQLRAKKEVPVKGTTGVPIFRSLGYSPVCVCLYGNMLSVDWKESIGNVLVQVLNLDTNEIVLSANYQTQAGGTINTIIKKLGNYQITFTSILYEGRGEFVVCE